MEILEKISNIASYVLPILGALVLLVLLVLLIKVLGIIKDLKTVTNNVNTTVSTVNKYLDELNVTVHTVNNVSMSVEAIRVALTNLVKKAIDVWTKEYETIKAILISLLDKITSKKEEAVKEEQTVTETNDKPCEKMEEK